jgi:hypothetical protein
MVDELNDKCGLDLSHEFTLERRALTSEPENYVESQNVFERVVMPGGSHSSRLTDKLDDTCLEVMDISKREWRLTEESADEKPRSFRSCWKPRTRKEQRWCTSCLTT